MRIILACLVVTLVSCNRGKTLDLTKEEIVDYVDACLDTALIYDIEVGPRYSNDDKSYQVTEYSQYDTLILHTIEEFSTSTTTRTNIYYKEELPVYIEEYLAVYEEDQTRFTERKIYLNGRDIIESEERNATSEFEMEYLKFKSVELNVDNYEIGKSGRSLRQEGEFAMQYSEFFVVGNETYLILKNPESNYSVALYIIEGDAMLDNLYTEPKLYEGKPLYFDYQHALMGGIERMVYKTVELVEQ